MPCQQGLCPVDSGCKYYSSLGALDADLFQAQKRVSARLTPRSNGARLLVCHDFQGGYTEDASVQGYTFEHWYVLGLADARQLCDTFVYFSHQRVSLPPQEWVFAAHQHGTPILGTLIFEWAESLPDLRTLLAGPQALHTPFAHTFSKHYADRLVTLAEQRGIQGFLINVEAPLNLTPTKNALLEAVYRTHSAELLRQWVEYFRMEGERRIGDTWQVVWYDSVIYPAGQLAWQDALTPANAPYFSAAHAIFTNYTWSDPKRLNVQEGFHPALLLSAAMADSLCRARNSVYIGIDVFGRNCHGCLDTYRSLDMIGPQNSRVIPPPDQEADLADDGAALGLSVALFAPGWTWEHKEQTWEKWWETDLHFWASGPHAVARYFSPRHIPFHRAFRTNFGRGAGRNWYVQGLQVCDTPWTDMSVSAPKPVLAWPVHNTSYSSRMVESAWSGTHALCLDVPAHETKFSIPLLTLDPGAACNTECIVRICAQSPIEITPSFLPTECAVVCTTLPNAWVAYETRCVIPNDAKLGIIVPPSPVAVQIVLGQLDVYVPHDHEVHEASLDGNMAQWPDFAPYAGYEIFLLDKEPVWLGTCSAPCAHVPDTESMYEIRSIGALPGDSVAYLP